METGQCYRQIELESMGYKGWEGALPAASSGGNFVKEAVPVEEPDRSSLAETGWE